MERKMRERSTEKSLVGELTPQISLNHRDRCVVCEVPFQGTHIYLYGLNSYLQFRLEITTTFNR